MVRPRGQWPVRSAEPGVIGPQWSGPLQNRMATSVPGLDGVTFDEVTDRTFAQISPPK